MHQFRWEDLVAQCSGRDLVRLLCQHSPSIGAWLSAIPSSALGTEISPAIYRILLSWWLGLSFANQSGDLAAPLKCPFCDDAMDSFGDHLLCCSKAEFYSRHQAIVKSLTMFVAAAGVRVTNEVQVDGRERPADIFLDRWATTEPVAVDVTVTHPFGPQARCASSQRSGSSERAAKRCEIRPLHMGHATELHPGGGHNIWSFWPACHAVRRRCGGFFTPPSAPWTGTIYLLLYVFYFIFVV